MTLLREMVDLIRRIRNRVELAMLQAADLVADWCDKKVLSLHHPLQVEPGEVYCRECMRPWPCEHSAQALDRAACRARCRTYWKGEQ